jgi:hypothetical protein
MNYPAASNGVSSGKFNRPKGRGIKPSSAAGGLNSKKLMLLLREKLVMHSSFNNRNSLKL